MSETQVVSQSKSSSPPTFLERVRSIKGAVDAQDGQVLAQAFGEEIYRAAALGDKFTLLALHDVTAEPEPAFAIAIDLIKKEGIKVTVDKGKHCCYHVATW